MFRRAENGSLLTSRRYGVHLTSDDGGTPLVQDSAIRAEKSAIVVKNSNFKNFLASKRWFPPSKNISISIIPSGSRSAFTA